MPYPFVDEIKLLREAHPELGKDKLFPLLHTFCQSRHYGCPSSGTIGRLIADAPWECVALDTIEKRLGNLKRYIITLTDPYSHYAFTAAVPRHTSDWAKRAFESAQRTYPYPFKKALTDNDSKFKNSFDRLLKELDIPHRHTYPNTPQMNAHCERFNRTIQEDFVD